MLTGILRMSLFQMLLASTPFVITITVHKETPFPPPAAGVSVNSLLILQYP